MNQNQEILRRIRLGDVKEFESLFRSSYVSLVKYAKYLIRDHDTAEEIVQDLFVKLWEDKEKLNIDSSLNGYLYRSVHNRCLHHVEHLRVVEKHAGNVLRNNETLNESPADILQYTELEEKVSGIMRRLPERCGQIFYMSRFEGMKYSEIAEKLSISIKTVESNIGRALKEFRKQLAER